MSFDKFVHKYDNYVTNHPGQAWADFEGTQATDETEDAFATYLSQTSFTSEITHNSTDSESFRLDRNELEAFLHDDANGGLNPITSDGSALKVEMRDNDTTGVRAPRVGQRADSGVSPARGRQSRRHVRHR